MKKNTNKILLIFLSCLCVNQPVQATFNDEIINLLNSSSGVFVASLIGLCSGAVCGGTAILCYKTCLPYLAHKYLTCYKRYNAQAAPAPENDEERGMPAPLDSRSLRQTEINFEQAIAAQFLESTQDDESSDVQA